MTEERKREVIANYCGLTNPEEFPDYLNDHDAIDQVVKNLSDYDLEDYRESLYCDRLSESPEGSYSASNWKIGFVRSW